MIVSVFRIIVEEFWSAFL